MDGKEWDKTAAKGPMKDRDIETRLKEAIRTCHQEGIEPDSKHLAQLTLEQSRRSARGGPPTGSGDA
jgi:hypothetical protein